MPKPVVAGVNGVAAGAGMSLALGLRYAFTLVLCGLRSGLYWHRLGDGRLGELLFAALSRARTGL